MKKLLLALAFVGTAQAATQNITISGTVSSVCAFASATNGVFGFDVQTPQLLDTGGAGGTNAQLAGSNTSGATLGDAFGAIYLKDLGVAT